MATLLSSLIAQARRQLQDLGALATPALPTVTPTGTPGATAHSYVIVALAQNGVSAASAAGSTTTGHATLSSANFNRLVWTAVTGATAYRVYRTIGGLTQGLIATVGNTLTLDDTGLVGDASIAPAAAVGTVFWSDVELFDIALDGVRDLWRAFVDLHQEHYFTIDATNVSLADGAATLTGVPADVFRVLLIEPRDTTSLSTHGEVRFKPSAYNSPEFIRARARANTLGSALLLRLVYIPTLPTLTPASVNPIPGESDQALKAWIIAQGSAKQRDDNSPDPNWLAIYGTEKQACLTVSTPRQEQEPRYLRGAFDDDDDNDACIVLFAITQAGSPVAAPTIYVAVV
jgi:hypothetical protein